MLTAEGAICEAHRALSAAADADQYVEDEIDRGRREGDDVEVSRVEVLLQGRYRIEQQPGGRLDQHAQAVHGVRQNIRALPDVGIHQPDVDEYEQDDQGEYRADEAHPLSPSVRDQRRCTRTLPTSLPRAVLGGQYSKSLRDSRRPAPNAGSCSARSLWWFARNQGACFAPILWPGRASLPPIALASYRPRGRKLLRRPGSRAGPP